MGPYDERRPSEEKRERETPPRSRSLALTRLLAVVFVRYQPIEGLEHASAFRAVIYKIKPTVLQSAISKKGGISRSGVIVQAEPSEIKRGNIRKWN